MDLFNERWKKIIKKTKNYLYGAILFFVLALGCFGWAYYINYHIENGSATLHELIYNGSTKEKDITSLTVTEKPYVFAEYDSNTTSPKYYFLMDEDYLYVGYLDYDTYTKLDKDSIMDEPITIRGVTKRIPDDVIDIAIEVYNEDLEEAFLTKENYKDYIGEICIDTVSDLKDNIFQMILGALFSNVSIIYLIIYIFKNHKIRKVKKNDMLWQDVQSELGSSETIEYAKFSTYLTPNYIMDGSKGLQLISYQDIIWIYLHENKYNGVTNNRNLVVITRNKKKHYIADLSGLRPKIKDTYLDLMRDIYEKNQDILVGYTKENRKQAKDLYQIK